MASFVVLDCLKHKFFESCPFAPHFARGP